MLLQDLIDFAAARIIEALRKIIAAKEHGHNPPIPARWDDTTIELPSAMLPNFLGNRSLDRDLRFRVEKDGLHGPNSPSRQLASRPFSIGTPSGELGPQNRICRVCSRKKQPVLVAGPSRPANRLFGQISDAQKVNFVRSDAEGNHVLGNHSDQETEKNASANPSGQVLGRKRPADAGITAVARPLNGRSEAAKEVSRRIGEIKTSILALQLSSPDAKPTENTYRPQNEGVICYLRGAEEWKRPVQSSHFSVKDVNHRKRIPAQIDSTEAAMVNPVSTSQSASDDARMSSSGPDLMIHGSRAPSSHANVYKTSRSRWWGRLMSKESLSAAMRTQKSRSRISPDSESDSPYHRYESLKKFPTQSRGHTNRRTSRIYELGSEDSLSGESRRSRETVVTKRPEKNSRSSPWESENSRSRLSSRYVPSSHRTSGRGSGAFSESYSSSLSSQEYSAVSGSSTRLYDKSSSYTYSIPSHRGHMNPRKIQGRRREFKMCVQANHEKVAKRLRRLKNRASLIFHHHHHHYHPPEQEAFWKPSRNAFRRKDRGEIVKRSRKRNGHVKSQNDQVSHFRSLLQGLLGHLRRSKKSEGYVLRNHGAKKLHWWQTLHRQRRGVTMLQSRGRAKLKLGRRPLINL